MAIAFNHYARHGTARVNRENPRCLAVCDRCGFIYNHEDLSWQPEWNGPLLQNTKILVCESCFDNHQEQLRMVILPADSSPIRNARPDNYPATVNSTAPSSAFGPPV